jgi:hypothetical protein
VVDSKVPIEALRDCKIERAHVNARFQITSKPRTRWLTHYCEDVSVYEFHSFSNIATFMFNRGTRYSADLSRSASRGRSVIAGFDWIDSTHRLLAGLLFDDMCHQPGRLGDHQNIAKRGDSFQIGNDGTAAGGPKRRARVEL